jgi:hypothetical protein
MPGHIGEQFILADHDRHLGPEFTRNKSTLPTMCAVPRLQFFNDTTNYNPLVTLWWARFRLLDASLLPWEPGQKMTDVNPHTLTPTHHPIQSCRLGNGERGT